MITGSISCGVVNLIFSMKAHASLPSVMAVDIQYSPPIKLSVFGAVLAYRKCICMGLE